MHHLPSSYQDRLDSHRESLGTSFSVVHAIIFMIWFDTPIVNDVRFRQYMLPYKLFMDDLFLIWTCSSTVRLMTCFSNG